VTVPKEESMKRLKEDLKNRTFHSVYLLYGEEDYLKRMYRDRLKKAVLGDSDEMNYSYFEGKGILLPDLREAADTLPFFSDYRIVIVENSGLFKASSEVADYLSQMPDTTVLVFVEKEIDKRNKLYKYVNKNGLALEMGAMSGKEMKLWVATLLKENDRQMRESTAQYFLEQVDNSMTNVKNELDKLIAYTHGREEITKEDVDQVCSVQITGKIFQMMDAVAMGNRDETLHDYHDLLALRESPMSILYLLSRHFHILLQIKSMMGKTDKAEMAKKAGVPPFTVGKYQSQCRRFSEEMLQQMLELCMDTEYHFKRGDIGDQMGVELLLLSFLLKKRSTSAR
jgi:DNA polymerase-3 subunit delta